MNKLNQYCVDEGSIIKEAIAVIQGNLSRCVIVINQKKKVLGVFSEGDVLRAILQDIDVHTPLKRVMKPSFYYLNERDLDKAHALVKKHGITLIPVIDANFILKDVITIFDVLDYLFRKDAKGAKE